MKASTKFDIIVYGATGFTGQLVAEYLAAEYRNDKALKWAMAGRSLDKLKSVRDAIGAPSDTPLIAADSNDVGSLKAMVDQTRSSSRLCRSRITRAAASIRAPAA